MSDSITAPLRGTYWVLPGQLLAGEYPGEPERALTEKRLRALIGAGIRTFIDLTDEDEINEDAKAIPAYRSILRQVSEEDSIQVTYANIPIEDRGVPSPWTLRCILDVIDRSVADENPVFVHCWAGRGRTGTVVGCYLKRHGLAQDGDVIQKLAQLRKDLPNAQDTSPHTKEQIRMVVTWKKGI
ncbi:MAG TPA: tyrosine-protein phosphatase [Candidatus Sulfotelmatobacter sp.]|nr:tyrosine-protein phosphatase [Candidatus Sulfotelmatobacter sp.]